MKRAWIGVALLGVAAGAGAEIVTTDRGAPDESHGGAREWVDRVICVDGLKLFQTWPVGYPASTIQLYEERDGKVVPAQCPEKGAGEKPAPRP